jgi:hypothetical protein
LWWCKHSLSAMRIQKEDCNGSSMGEHARAMATRINPSRPSIPPHSLSFSQTHLFCGLLSRCLDAAAAVKTRLLAHIEKKPRAPSTDIADTAPDASFVPERLAA